MKTPHALLFSPIHAACPTHLNLLDLFATIIFGEDKNQKVPHYVILSSFLWLPPSEAHFLNALLLKTLCPHFLPFHPHIKHTKITDLCILISLFLDSKSANTTFWTNGSSYAQWIDKWNMGVKLPSASVQNLLMPGSHNRCSYEGSLFAFSLSGLHWGMLHWNWGPMFTWGVASDSGAESLLVVGPCWLSSEPDDSPPLPSARIWWCWCTRMYVIFTKCRSPEQWTT